MFHQVSAYEYSDEATVDSGIPQGTVLGPILFLCHINDLPNSVKSSVRLFADDFLLYREMNNENDNTTIQNDLKDVSSCVRILCVLVAYMVPM
jgi:hypothetical protein